MKILKILLIFVLLVVMCSISFGTGTITSGDKIIYLSPEPEEQSILNEWFKNLPITEQMELYAYWQNRDLNWRLKQVEKELRIVKKMQDWIFKFLDHKIGIAGGE